MDVDSMTRDLLKKLEAEGQFKAREQDSAYDSLMGFFHAVNWREDRWIWGVLAVYLLLFLLLRSTRERVLPQVVLLGSMSAIVYNLETLNALGNVYWRRFATQNYFDEGGIFLVIFVGSPLMLLLFYQVVSALWTTAHLLVKVKKKEMKKKMN